MQLNHCSKLCGAEMGQMRLLLACRGPSVRVPASEEFPSQQVRVQKHLPFPRSSPPHVDKERLEPPNVPQPRPFPKAVISLHEAHPRTFLNLGCCSERQSEYLSELRVMPCRSWCTGPVPSPGTAPQPRCVFNEQDENGELRGRLLAL